MITMEQWMRAVSYRVTEGSAYFPDGRYDLGNFHILDSWDGENDGVSASIVFNTDTQDVLEVMVHDFANEVAYRLINKSINSTDDNVAWDGVNYIDLECDDDMMEKLTAIMNYEAYDDRVKVELNLSDDEVFMLMKMAHEADVSFNQFITLLLEKYIEEHVVVNR